MKAVRIDNPVLNSYLTDVAVDYVSGTSLTVRSNNSFAANDLIVFGKSTEELTELKKIDAISGNTILTLASALKFQHNKGTPVYKSLWDTIELEGRSSSAGVFAVLTQSPIQWDSKENRTIYHHSDGNDSWQYRFRFYNSATTLYSEYSPTLGGAGFTKFQMGYIIQNARRIAGDRAGVAVTIAELLRAATRAKNIIRAHNPQFWFWKVDGYKNNKSVAATANNNVYSLASIEDLGVVNYIEFRYQSGNTDEKYILKRKSDAEFLAITRNLNRAQDDQPRIFRLLPPDDSSSKGYFEIDNEIKNTGVGTFYVSYYKEETDYNSVDDTTAILTPEIIEDYLISEIYRTKGNDQKGDEYYNFFTGPRQRDRTSMGTEKLSGIALLDELDKQYKQSQDEPRQLWRFRGQKAMSRLYGSRHRSNTDDMRENYFDGYE